MLALVVLVAVVLLALPHILSTDWVRSSVVKRANAATPDSVVEIRAWSWRWFAPCRIEGLAVRKRDQSYSFRVESVSSSKGLAAWLGFRQNFGTITVDGPALTVMAVPPPEAGRGAAAEATAPIQPAAVQTAPVAAAARPRRGIPYPLNPYGHVIVTGGRAEAFPLNAPIVRVSGLEASATFAGLDGPLALSAASSLPQTQGIAVATNEAIAVTAQLASLRALLLDPAALGFEASLAIPSVDLTALEAFLPVDASRPRIGSGRADAQLTARRGTDGSLELTGHLNTRGVRLTDGALAPDKLAWEQASLTVDLQQRPGGVLVRELRLESPFVGIKASGSIVTATAGGEPGGALVAEGHVDLAALAAQLPTTLNLRPGVTIQRGVVRFDAEANARAEGTRVFALLRCDGVDALCDRRPLRVDLPFTLGVNARLSPEGQPQHGMVALKSVPVTLTLEGDAKKGTAAGDADLGALHAALSPLLELGSEPKATGMLALQGGWAASGDGLAVTGNVLATKLRFRRDGTKPFELASANVKASATLPSAGAKDELRMRRVSVEASVPYATVRLSVDEALPQQGVLRGFAASLDGEWEPLMALAGAAGGTPIADAVSASVSGDLDPDTLRMKEFRVAAGPFGVKGSGALSALKGERRVDVGGTLDVDLDTLQAVLKKKELDGVVLSGRSSRPFKVSAPLGGGRAYLLSELKAEAGVLAEKIAGLGMTAQNTAVDVTIQDGQLALRTLATVNEGQLKLAPTVDLLAVPPLLTLPRNSRVLADAKLTQGMVEQQLARVHPILRGCTVSSGWLTVDVAECAIPVASNAVQRMAWTTKMTFRDTRLAAAGPLAEAADALRLKHKEVLITNQTISVSCRDGRFYPQPLDLTVGGHAFRVAGSVGVDGSLDYGVEIPLTESLVGEQAYRYLRGQTVRVPISGTSAKPRLDAGAIQTEIRRLVAGVAARVATEQLQDELRDQLKGGIRDFDKDKLEDALRKLRR